MMTRSMVFARVACVLLLVFALTVDTHAECMMGGGWNLASPAIASEQPININLSISGHADDEALSWVCTITDSSEQTGTPTGGSSTCISNEGNWAGTYLKPGESANWVVGTAHLVVTHGGEDVVTEDFTFVGSGT